MKASDGERRGEKVWDVYLGDERLAAVPLHRHGEVQPGPGVVVVLQAGQHQVQVLPVHAALLSLETEGAER